MHSKSEKLCYENLSLQDYLRSGTNSMTIKEKSFCFAARSRMIDVRCNRLHGQIHLKCRLGCDTSETQNHLLVCEALTDSSIVKELPEYSDLFGKDVDKMETVSKILQTKFKLLNELDEPNQVNGSVQPPTGVGQSCSASDTNVYVPNVNVGSNDDLD